MKIPTIILAILLTTTYSAPNCPITNRCRACSTTTNTNCDYCYTWGSQSMAGAYSTATTCAASLPSNFEVEHCKIYDKYSPSSVYTGMADYSSIATPRCLECDGFDFLEIDETSSTETCTNVQANSYTNPICLSIEFCRQTACQKGTNGDSIWCNQCMPLQIPSSIEQVGTTRLYKPRSCKDYASDDNDNTISNCYYYEHDTSSSTLSLKCRNCACGYVSDFEGTECSATSTVTVNCEKMVSGGPDCYMCWAGYQFNGNVCELLSWMISTISLVSLLVNLYV